MPLISLSAAPVEQVDIPFDRIALRCNLNAVLEEDVLISGDIQIQSSKYRKLRKLGSSSVILDVCGQDHAVCGASFRMGDSPDIDQFIQSVAQCCRNYAIPDGGSAAIICNLGWRSNDGDVVGILHLTVTPTVESSTSIVIASGDTDATGSADITFAGFMKDLLSLIKTRTDVLGW